jgi:type IX secretion system PorP/SprF family membrane protein
MKMEKFLEIREQSLFLGRKKLILLSLMVIFVLQAKAQDPVYSLFYLNKMALNPAYAGANRDLNFSVMSRMQWTGVPGKMQTTTASLDVACPSSKLGFGAMFYNDQAGEGFLTKTQGTFVMSANLPGRYSKNIGLKGLRGRKYIFSAGLSYGVGQRRVDWSTLVFSDQIDELLGVYKPSNALIGSAETSNLVHDLSGGILFRSEISKSGSFLSTGFSIYHINRPVESFYGENITVPIRYSGHLYFNIKTSGKYKNGTPSFLTLGGNVDYQATLQTALLGGTYTFGKNILLGVWYRNQKFNLPNSNTNSAVFNMVYSMNWLSVGYSFDLTTSQLGLDQTYGAHEVGINIRFDQVYLCKNKSKSNRSDRKCFMVDHKHLKKNELINFLP